MFQNPVIAEASSPCDHSDRLIGLASHDWFIQRVSNRNNLFISMTSLTCKFLQSYTDFWQELRGFSPPLLTLIPTLRNAIDQEIVSQSSIPAFLHSLSHSCFHSIVCSLFLPHLSVCLGGQRGGVDSTHLLRLLSDSLAVLHFHLVMEWMMILGAHNHWPPGQYETSWNLPSHPSFFTATHTPFVFLGLHTLSKQIHYIWWQHIGRNY